MEKGIDSFKDAVLKDCQGGENCFSENGCDKKGAIKCFHKYCDKYKWVIDRAKHYAEKMGADYLDVLKNWEDGRSYWYMNYYQDCNQPLIESKGVVMLDDWLATIKERFGENKDDWKFVCPSCGHIQSMKDFSDS